MSIALRVSGRPVPKGSGEGTRARRASFDHGVAGDWQQRLALAFRRSAPRRPFLHAVQVDAVFFCPSPLSRLPGREDPMLVPPDLDKLLRFVLDEAKGHFYLDDAQTVEGHIAKRWAVDDDADRGAGVALRFTDLGLFLPPLPAWARALDDSVPELAAVDARRAS